MPSQKRSQDHHPPPMYPKSRIEKVCAQTVSDYLSFGSWNLLSLDAANTTTLEKAAKILGLPSTAAEIAHSQTFASFPTIHHDVDWDFVLVLGLSPLVGRVQDRECHINEPLGEITDVTTLLNPSHLPTTHLKMKRTRQNTAPCAIDVFACDIS